MIKIVGLGPGAKEALTIGTICELENNKNIFLRTEKHPTVDYLKEKGIDIADKLYDCGMLIYEGETKCSGGSGCGCSAVVLGSCIMDRLIRGEYKRVLFVPTGALLSTVSYNEGKSVPGIAHGVILEGKES